MFGQLFIEMCFFLSKFAKQTVCTVRNSKFPNLEIDISLFYFQIVWWKKLKILAWNAFVSDLNSYLDLYKYFCFCRCKSHTYVAHQNIYWSWHFVKKIIRNLSISQKKQLWNWSLKFGWIKVTATTANRRNTQNSENQKYHTQQHMRYSSNRSNWNFKMKLIFYVAAELNCECSGLMSTLDWMPWILQLLRLDPPKQGTHNVCVTVSNFSYLSQYEWLLFVKLPIHWHYLADIRYTQFNRMENIYFNVKQISSVIIICLSARQILPRIRSCSYVTVKSHTDYLIECTLIKRSFVEVFRSCVCQKNAHTRCLCVGSFWLAFSYRSLN